MKSIAGYLNEAVANGFEPTIYECTFELAFALGEWYGEGHPLVEDPIVMSTSGDIQAWLDEKGIILRGHPVREKA